MNPIFGRTIYRMRSMFSRHRYSLPQTMTTPEQRLNIGTRLYVGFAPRAQRLGSVLVDAEPIKREISIEALVKQGCCMPFPIDDFTNLLVTEFDPLSV